LVEKRKNRLFQIKTDTGKYLFLGFMIALFRPIPDGDDWPLYGDEYGRMKFGNYHEEADTGFQ
jgi:hypothetical protein